MSDTNSAYRPDGDWGEFMEEMNEQFLESLEQNMEAQAQFVEAWSETLEASADEERVSEGVQGYARAYEVWMDAAQEMVERVGESAAEDEEIDVEEFRDVWLNSANEAFKEVMSTSAFAAATGETIQDAMEAQRIADDTAEATLRQLRLPTQSDVEEIGERLVELERRQHEVEQKLDRVLEAVEE